MAPKRDGYSAKRSRAKIAELLATSSEEEESSHDGNKKPLAKKMQKTAKKGQKKSEQLVLFGAGVKRICNKSLLVGSMILLTAKIYAKKILEGTQGKLFLYKITSFDTDTELFSIVQQFLLNIILVLGILQYFTLVIDDLTLTNPMPSSTPSAMASPTGVCQGVI